MNVHARLAKRDFVEPYGIPGIACVIFAVVAMLYWPTFSRMVDMWSLGTYQHGWLVLPTVLFLLWYVRDKLATIQVRGSYLGLLSTFVLVLVWLVVSALNIQAAEFLAVTLMFITVFWSIVGSDGARRAIFPLMLLVFAVPTGEFLVSYLMEITASISMALLHASGVPAYRDGMFISLPGGNFEVARVCAGLRYLLAGLMVSMVFAYITYSSWYKRTVFVLLAAGFLIVANGFRAYMIMIVAAATEMRWLTGDDHIYFGMIVFGVVLAIMMWLGAKHADQNEPVNAAEPRTSGDTGKAPAPVKFVVLTLGLLLSGPIARAITEFSAPPATDRIQLAALPDCQGPMPWKPTWSPEYRGADQTTSVSYECGSHRVNVWWATYASQEQGKELISSVNRVWPREWRRYADEKPIRIDVAENQINGREVLVRGADTDRLIWYWYQVGGKVTGSAFVVKLMEAQDALRLRSSRASVFVLAVEPLTRESETRAVIRSVADKILANSRVLED